MIVKNKRKIFNEQIHRSVQSYDPDFRYMQHFLFFILFKQK